MYSHEAHFSSKKQRQEICSFFYLFLTNRYCSFLNASTLLRLSLTLSLSSSHFFTHVLRLSLKHFPRILSSAGNGGCPPLVFFFCLFASLSIFLFHSCSYSLHLFSVDLLCTTQISIHPHQKFIRSGMYSASFPFTIL